MDPIDDFEQFFAPVARLPATQASPGTNQAFGGTIDRSAGDIFEQFRRTTIVAVSPVH